MSTTSSINRMDTLNNLFTTYFGQHWPFILLGYLIFLIIILIQLYFFNLKVTVNDANALKFQRLIIVLIMVCSLILLVLGARTVREYLEPATNDDDIPAGPFAFGSGDFKCVVPYTQLTTVLGFILGIVFLLVVTIRWMFRK